MSGAAITNCNVYGVSVWDAQLGGALQSRLSFTRTAAGPTITVDNVQMAVVLNLLLSGSGVRDVLDTLTTKIVLVVGRFTRKRRSLLEAIRSELLARDYLAVFFDFEEPKGRDLIESIMLLAHMSRFVIADVTDAKSVLQELRSIVPNSPSVLVQPLLLASQEEPGMWDYFRKFPWVLEPVRYTDQAALIAALDEKVIAPAEAKALTAKS